MEDIMIGWIVLAVIVFYFVYLVDWQELGPVLAKGGWGAVAINIVVFYLVHCAITTHYVTSAAQH